MKINSTKAVIITIIILILLALILTHTKINTINELENPIKTKLDIYLWKIKLFSTKNTDSHNLILPIGKYKIIISSEGYDTKEIVLKNFNPFKKSKTEKIKLKATIINISTLRTYDPTGTIKISPFLEIKGINILGQKIKEKGKTQFMYGNYTATITDPHFESEIEIKGNKFYQNKQEIKTIKLEPGKNMIRLTEKETTYAQNFLKDFITLSASGDIQVNPGVPKQFYLSTKDAVLSLGDLIFIFCEKKVYEQEKTENPAYFIPTNKKYTLINNLNSFGECYSYGLNGYIAAQLNNPEIAEINKYNYKLSNDKQLNIKTRKSPIAFTFDIESGRYVDKKVKGTKAISPCTNNITILGLEKEEQICDNADKIAWFSPLIKNTNTEFPYPWISGIQGTKEILKHAQDYGIPLTFFIVDREAKAFEQLNPELIKQIKEQVNKKLIEMGSHTTTHTNLASLNEETATQNLMQSKKFLKEKFNTTITGMRGPYLSIVNNNIRTHENALKKAGFSYYSNDFYKDTALKEIINKPINFYYLTEGQQKELKQKINTWDHIITLDHPWNYFYDEQEINKQIYLKENPKNTIKAKATMLSAISEGAIPTTLQDLKIKEQS